jgi:hypothetical protein
LTTVEKLQVIIRRNIYAQTHGVQWRGFFNHLRQVKALHVPSQVALDVVHSFQQVDQEPNVDLLPALEQVNMDVMINQDHGAIADAFNSLIAARAKVGRPITLSFMTSRCAF